MSASRRAARWLGHEAIATVTARPFAVGVRAWADAADVAQNARMAARGIGRVTRGGRFGARTQIPTSIGGELFHGVSDKRAALDLLSPAFAHLAADVAKGPPELAAAARVTLDQWAMFAARQEESHLVRWATEWETYQAWWERLRDLRELARSQGVPLTTSDPPPLPRTLWQRGAEGTGSKLDAALTFTRDNAYAVLGVLGLWGLYTSIRNARILDLLR